MRRVDQLGRLAWLWVVRAWLLVPLLGWVSGFPPRVFQPWLWQISSLAVLIIGMSQPVRRPAPIFGGLLAGWAVVLAWTVPDAVSVGWMGHLQVFTGLLPATVILTSAWLIVERGEWRWVADAIRWSAWTQVACMSLDAWGPVHAINQTWLRAPRAVLLAVASLQTTGWRAWLFALASLGTSSLMGLPACVRLVRVRLVDQAHWLPMTWPVGALGLLAFTHRLWGPRLALRWDVWASAPWSWGGMGWGVFPGGFLDDVGFHAGIRWLDYHSTVVDWVVRTGWLGGLLAIGGLWWVWRRTAHRRVWGMTAQALWVACWQSVEAIPVLAILGLVWIMQLSWTQESSCRS